VNPTRVPRQHWKYYACLQVQTILNQHVQFWRVDCIPVAALHPRSAEECSKGRQNPSRTEPVFLKLSEKARFHSFTLLMQWWFRGCPQLSSSMVSFAPWTLHRFHRYQLPRVASRGLSCRDGCHPTQQAGKRWKVWRCWKKGVCIVGREVSLVGARELQFGSASDPSMLTGCNESRWKSSRWEKTCEDQNNLQSIQSARVWQSRTESGCGFLRSPHGPSPNPASRGIGADHTTEAQWGGGQVVQRAMVCMLCRIGLSGRSI